MLTALLLALATAVALGAGFGFRRRRVLLEPVEEKKLLLGAAPRERTEVDLRRGDIIQHEGRDFLVEGVVRYDEDGHRWLAGRVVDGTDERWLWVDPDQRPGLKFLQIAREIDASGMPPEVLLARGLRFSFHKRGNANASFDGSLGDLAKARGDGSVIRCQFWLYRAAGDDTLIVERWGDLTRVLIGTDVLPGILEFLPGS